MTFPALPPNFREQIRVLQIIWFGLAFASVSLLVAFWYTRDELGQRPVWDGSFPLTPVLVGVGVLMALLSFVLPDAVGKQVNPGEPPSFVNYQVARIVQGAMLEAATILQGVAYLFEGEWWVLCVGGAFVVLLLASFPTRDTATRWLQRQSRPR